MRDLDFKIYHLRRRIRFAEIGWPLSTNEEALMPRLREHLSELEADRKRQLFEDLEAARIMERNYSA
jgi:hypothetical protein